MSRTEIAGKLKQTRFGCGILHFAEKVVLDLLGFTLIPGVALTG